MSIFSRFHTKFQLHIVFVGDSITQQGGASDGYALIEEDQAQKSRLETLALKGINSGPSTPMTPDDWDNIRAAVRQNLSQGKGKYDNAFHHAQQVQIFEQVDT